MLVWNSTVPMGRYRDNRKNQTQSRGVGYSRSYVPMKITEYNHYYRAQMDYQPSDMAEHLPLAHDILSTSTDASDNISSKSRTLAWYNRNRRHPPLFSIPFLSNRSTCICKHDTNSVPWCYVHPQTDRATFQPKQNIFLLLWQFTIVEQFSAMTFQSKSDGLLIHLKK
jgi:hypothetical protein